MVPAKGTADEREGTRAPQKRNVPLQESTVEDVSLRQSGNGKT
jgi:hypothetical protein